MMYRATIKYLPAALMALAATTSSGCGDSDDPGEGNGRGTSEPVYVIYTTIDTPDSRTGHFVTTSSIEGDVPIDVTKGIEEPGGGQLYAPPGEGYFLLAGGEAPTFTRYGLDAAGKLEKGKTVSFANLGVKETWGHVIFVDANKAYFLDASQLQVISFNPTTMEINRAIPVPDFRCEEMVTSFGMPVRRDDGFYFPRSCWDLDKTSAGATLVHLDPKTDQVTVTQDPRCMGMQVGFLASSGDAYWFSDHDASAEWAYQRRNAPHDCALRLRAGQTTFDKDWALDLTTRTGGVSAVAAVPGAGSTIWVKVFDEAAMPKPVPVTEIDWTVKAWRWGHLDVEGNGPVTLDTQSPLVVSYGAPIVVDGRSFSPATTFSDSGDLTTLVEITQAGVRDRAIVRGELRKVARLR
jgi:hypothetical protein